MLVSYRPLAAKAVLQEDISYGNSHLHRRRLRWRDRAVADLSQRLADLLRGALRRAEVRERRHCSGIIPVRQPLGLVRSRRVVAVRARHQLITDASSTRPRQFASGPVFWEREGKLRIAGFLGQGRVALASFTAWVIDRSGLCNFSGGSDRVNCF